MAADPLSAPSKRGVCIAHGEVEADLYHDGQPRCPVVIASMHDCGYGDPCARLLAPIALDQEHHGD